MSTLYGNLTTSGRKTGAPHTVELTYALEGNHIYLLAHKNSDGTATHWYHNLEANPKCRFEVAGQIYDAVAHSLKEDAFLEGKIRKLFEEKGGRDFYTTWYKDTSRIPVVLEIQGKSV